MLDQHKVNEFGAHARKSDAQMPGQYQRDPHNRRGQYTSAGNSGLMKK
jgi:hypothetical protein